MTATEFNAKWKPFIEKGFEDQGLEIDNEDVTEYLDELFEDVTKLDPNLRFSQIKLKFGRARAYIDCRLLHVGTVEKYIDNLLNK